MSRHQHAESRRAFAMQNGLPEKIHFLDVYSFLFFTFFVALCSIFLFLSFAFYP